MKAPELPDKIYVREYQNGYYTTWWDEKPYEEESIGMKAVCYIRKDALLEWLESVLKCKPQDAGLFTEAAAIMLQQIIDKINSL